MSKRISYPQFLVSIGWALLVAGMFLPVTYLTRAESALEGWEDTRRQRDNAFRMMQDNQRDRPWHALPQTVDELDEAGVAGNSRSVPVPGYAFLIKVFKTKQGSLDWGQIVMHMVQIIPILLAVLSPASLFYRKQLIHEGLGMIFVLSCIITGLIYFSALVVSPGEFGLGLLCWFLAFLLLAFSQSLARNELMPENGTPSE